MKPIESFVGDLFASVETGEAAFTRAQFIEIWAQISPSEAAPTSSFAIWF
jgi:hypothetical protein